MAPQTTAHDLAQLNVAVQTILTRVDVRDTIERLKREVVASPDTFVWSELSLAGLSLPRHILSGWIFVLKADTPSGAHLHPNSVQHMLMLEGRGQSCVGDRRQALTTSEWVVIPERVPHEFFPEKDAMVVMSFHTCIASELEEVAIDDGRARHYAHTP